MLREVDSVSQNKQETKGRWVALLGVFAVQLDRLRQAGSEPAIRDQLPQSGSAQAAAATDFFLAAIHSFFDRIIVSRNRIPT